MEENCPVPPPTNFNSWKHHAGFIKQQIQTFSQKSDSILLKKHILKIGESQMDLYFGKYTLSEISKEIISYLKKEKSFSFDKYIDWLKSEGGDYKLVRLSDKSIWTLRLSENSKEYIHIHPARYSLHTIRVKANTLKSAILILCFEQFKEIEVVNTEMVNSIRKRYLNESPIKSFSNATGLRRAIDLLRD